MTPAQIAGATLVVFLGAVLQGSIGFGLGLFGAPLLLLIDSRLVPGPLLAASGVLTFLLARREWSGVRGGELGWALGGRLAGTLAAMAVLSLLPAERLDLLLGVLILVAVAVTTSGLHPRPTPPVLLGAGALSGFMGTTTTIGGPPIALAYSRESGPRLRGTLSAFFVVGVAVSILGLAAVGRFGLAELRLAGLLLPGVLAGFVASRRTSSALDGGLLRPVVLGVSAVSAVVVIVRHLYLYG